MPVARKAGISSRAATPVGTMWYLAEMFSASAFARIEECRLLQGSAPYSAVIEGEVSRGIWVPVPGPMSSTIPEAVRRIGGIRAEEPTGSGISWLFGSELIWREAVVRVVWLGVLFYVALCIFFIGVASCGFSCSFCRYCEDQEAPLSVC